MPYKLWCLPGNKPASELRRNELVVYKYCFIEVIPRRTRLLNNKIAKSSGFEQWTGAPTVASLETISEWLSQQVLGHWGSVESRSANELVSMSWDVGLHMASVLIAQQGWQWQQYLKSRRIVDYGHMVVAASNGTFRNTLRQANVIVDRIRAGQWQAGDMLAQYQYAVMEGEAPQT